MTSPIVAQVIGLERVQSRLLREIPDYARGRVARAVRVLGLVLQRRVVSQKLAGEALNRRTGRLARSVNTKFDSPDENTFTSTTGTKLSYGKFWELGFSGIETVRAHVRKVASRSTRANKAKDRGRSVGIGFVREHTRVVNIAPRSFLRSALRELAPEIHDQLAAAVGTLDVAGGG